MGAPHQAAGGGPGALMRKKGMMGVKGDTAAPAVVAGGCRVGTPLVQPQVPTFQLGPLREDTSTTCCLESSVAT